MTENRFLYCWFDTEYTTLDLNQAQLLQIALIVTDDNLIPIPLSPKNFPGELLRQDGFSAFIKPPPRKNISEHVLENYQPLLTRCESDGINVDAADELLTSYLNHLPETRASNIQHRPIMAGNTIHADYFLSRKYLPRFTSLLNYRIFDVSTLKLEWLFHYRGTPFKKKDNAKNIQRYYKGKDKILGNQHDAYYDIQASMAELAFYRTKISFMADGQ